MQMKSSVKAAIVAQTSKSAVSRISKSASAANSGGARKFGHPADWEVGDTAGLETCATAQAARSGGVQ
jgi:hypothetical protein